MSKEKICKNCGHGRNSHKDKWGGICVGCPCPGFEPVDAAESLPAQPEPEPAVEDHMRNMHKVIDCFAEANQVEGTGDCRVYADYAKTRLIGSGQTNRRAWADAVLCCTCECDHLKMQHGGTFCNTQGCQCQGFRSVKSATIAVEGTYSCPICGCATPHAHSDEQVAEWRNPQPVAPVEAKEKCGATFEANMPWRICNLLKGHDSMHQHDGIYWVFDAREPKPTPSTPALNVTPTFGRPTVEDILEEWAEGKTYGKDSHFIKEFSRHALTYIESLKAQLKPQPDSSSIPDETDPCKMTDAQYEEYIYGPNRAEWPTNQTAAPPDSSSISTETADYLLGRCIPHLDTLAHHGNQEAQRLRAEIAAYAKGQR